MTLRTALASLLVMAWVILIGSIAEEFPLWIRGESEADAETQGQAWADAEPLWTFVRVASVTPHPEFWHVWSVVVEASPVNPEPMTLGLA